MALPFFPFSLIQCPARSTPIDKRAASEAEKKADAIKHIVSHKISWCEEASVRGGSMDQSLLKYENFYFTPKAHFCPIA